MAFRDLFKKKPKLQDVVEPEYADLLDEAKERHQDAEEADEEQRQRELDDLAFCESGSQWPDDVRASRESEGRPCLEVDRINTFVRNVCNELRQQRPHPQVNPTGYGAEKETAEVLQGMIRHIAYMSSGDTAIDTASESMVRCGRGFFRLLTEYVEGGFEQEIVIKRIPNLHSVLIDPASAEPDGSDMRYAFIDTYLTRSEYRQLFPKSKLNDLSSAEWQSVGNEVPEWAGQDGQTCLVSEYFKRVREPITLCRLIDNSVVDKRDVAPGEDGKPDASLITEERESYEEKVYWYKINAIEVLDKTEWPGKWIPIFPIYGNELWIGNRRVISGLVRSAKDPQRHYNYLKSAEAEDIALAPKAPVIAPAGSLGSGEMRAAWKNVNKKAVAVLEYNSRDSQGNEIPAPQRLSNEVNISGITQALMGSVDDLKATTGMFDPSLGNREASQSGVAIQKLQRQGQVGNFHYSDNVSRTVRHLGRALIDLIQRLYTQEQIVKIVKPDDSTELVKVNGPTGEKNPETGTERVYRLDVGRYDVTVSVGPSYQSKIQEAQELMQNLMQSPMGQMLTQIAPDIVVSMMDLPLLPELKERLKKAVPAQFQDQKDKQQQLPPEVQQRLQEADQVIQSGQQHIQQLLQAVQLLQGKLDSKQMELASKERIAELQVRAELLKTEATIEGQGALAQLKAELDAISARMNALLTPPEIPNGEPEDNPAE